MASPVMATVQMEVKDYVGNNQNLNLTGNKTLSFVVVGDNCDVKLRDNLASIKIVGNHCTLHVLSGSGRILHIGNNGTIHLGKGIDEDVVTYVGKNGSIISKSGTIQPSEIVSPIAATFVMEVKQYVGNNLNLDLKGKRNLSYVVVGNNCDVQLRDNLASIKIEGNNCTLRVYSGRGSIIYIGNNGTIYLDRSIGQDVVTYEGNNGSIIWMSGTIQPSEIVSPIAAPFEEEINQYIGDNLNMNLKGKRNVSYLVVGNNCDVQLSKNLGSIKFEGNNCTLRVYSGSGSIIYIGNDGTIYLDRSIDKDVVTYTGDNITISWMSTIQRHSSVDDIRKFAGSMEVIDLNGECNISIPNVRTAVKTFMHIASMVLQPNIQQLSSVQNAKH